MIRIQIIYVIIGLLLGFLIMYLTTSPPKIILKYPTLETLQNMTFVDQNNQCFKYYATEISCN